MLKVLAIPISIVLGSKNSFILGQGGKKVSSQKFSIESKLKFPLLKPLRTHTVKELFEKLLLNFS
jgi:hypothetical protein